MALSQLYAKRARAFRADLLIAGAGGQGLERLWIGIKRCSLVKLEKD